MILGSVSGPAAHLYFLLWTLLLGSAEACRRAFHLTDLCSLEICLCCGIGVPGPTAKGPDLPLKLKGRSPPSLAATA